MEILQFIASFLLEKFGKDYLPVFNVLKENSFDLGKTLKNLSPEQLKPIMEGFMKNKKVHNSYEPLGVSPIINICDEQILKSLNKYFAV